MIHTPYTTKLDKQTDKQTNRQTDKQIQIQNSRMSTKEKHLLHVAT